MKLKKEFINAGQLFIWSKAKKLIRHTERNKDTTHVNYKVHHLLHDPFTFVNAYAKISKNKGALARGHEDDNAIELFGKEKAKKIADKIKKNEYKFKPVKRTWIPKQGKHKKRPIDVPTQADRIVQEAIRAILEAIYEPVFQEQFKLTNGLSSNYGFRPNKSCWTAIEQLITLSKRCNIILEGDIISAFNKVDHEILLSILQKRIKDKLFLNLIKKMLKSGIMNEKTFEHSLEGTPQGGILSPLLFNIYMLELDKFVYEKIITPILNENQEKKNESVSSKYNKARYQKTKALQNYRAEKESFKVNKNHSCKVALKETKKILRKKNLELIKIPYNNHQLTKKGAIFVRYADDWVLALTATKKQAQDIKDQISKFLEKQLRMKLDNKKTKITSYSKGFKFLGFEIRMEKSKPKLMRVLTKIAKGKKERIFKRTTSRNITVEPDSQKILKRLHGLKMYKKNYFPIGKPIWYSYDEFQIVQKYAQIMRGIFNFYKPCKKLSRLYHISYILKFSCAKTIAGRKKISMPQVFRRYGKDLMIQKQIKGQKKEQIATQKFYDIITLRAMEKKNPTLNFVINTSDPFRIQEHWRTKFKVYNECCICGATDNIQLHHTNSIRSIKNRKKDNAQVIKQQINRKQISVCFSCHKDITHGKFNDPKSPIEFFNEFLAKL